MITRREVLLLAGVVVGSLYVFSPEAIKNHKTYKKLSTKSRLKNDWVQLGLPCAFDDKPSKTLIRIVKKHLKEELIAYPGFTRHRDFEFVLHAPEDNPSDPLLQKWEGGLKCLAKRIV